jgi:hypothetical protein
VGGVADDGSAGLGGANVAIPLGLAASGEPVCGPRRGDERGVFAAAGIRIFEGRAVGGRGGVDRCRRVRRRHLPQPFQRAIFDLAARLRANLGGAALLECRRGDALAVEQRDFTDLQEIQLLPREALVVGIGDLAVPHRRLFLAVEGDVDGVSVAERILAEDIVTPLVAAVRGNVQRFDHKAGLIDQREILIPGGEHRRRQSEGCAEPEKATSIQRTRS